MVAIVSSLVFFVFILAFFINNLWMGIVDPEAALAMEVLDQLQPSR